jgi:hypothetical protein
MGSIAMKAAAVGATVVALGVALSTSFVQAGAQDPQEMEETFRPIAMKCLANALLAYKQGNGDSPMSVELCPSGSRGVIEVSGQGSVVTLMRAGNQVGVITESGDLLWITSPETEGQSTADLPPAK